ncbi:MAG: hypothetical protein EOO15_16425, partial [Chitinophagaceae bacterium]
MKKITLLLVMFLLGFSAHSQIGIIENFDGTSVTTPTTPGPWTLPSGTWQIFDNGVGTLNWGLNTPAASFPANSAPNAAFINRQNIGANQTSVDYLATPLVTVPANPQVLFNTRTTVAGNNFTVFELRAAPASANPTDPASYTQLLATWNDDAITIPYDVYGEKVVDLSTQLTAGTQVYLAFVKVYTQPTGGINGERWLVDDIRFIEKCQDPDVDSLAANALATTATLSWDAGGSTSWQVHVMTNATVFDPAVGTPIAVNGTPSVVVSATTQPTITPLAPLTQYKYYVRAVCDNSNSEWVGPFTFTTQALPPECGGNFVDEGGVTGNYPASSNSIITICPDDANPTYLVTVTFTAFQTETNWDALYVFDGDSTSDPQIASANPAANVPGGLAGGYWGAAIPGPFTSSSADGCLTFWFRSDTSVQQAGWAANVTCAPPPTCPKPTALVPSAVTATSATLTWTNVGPGTSWEVLAVPCTQPAPTDATVGTPVTGTTYTFTNLLSSTCYNFYVRADCTSSNNGVSTWAGPVSATTQIAPPECGGVFVDAGGAGNYPANANTTWTICPDAANAGDLVTVTFSAFQTEANWDALYVYDGDSTSAPLIASTNGPGNVPGGLAGGYWGNVIPGPFEATGPTGCLTFVFRSDGVIQQGGWSGAVTCDPPPTCPRPTLLTATNPTSTTVQLAWQNNGPGTSWEVFAVPCGQPAPTASSVGVIVNTESYTFTGLNPLSCYNFYVRANCESTNNGISVWTGPASATTLIAPPECGTVFTDEGGTAANYPASSNTIWTVCPDPENPNYIVTVTFTAFQTETNWDALYVFNGNSTSAPQIASTNPPNNVPGGLAGGFWGNTIPGPFESSSVDGCLTFWFRSDTSVQQAGWVANVTCNPPPTCPKPNGLAANSITTGSAVLNWNQPANGDGFVASNWEILVLPTGSPIPTTSGIPTGNGYTAIGLQPGTCYTYYVRAICSATDSSAWAGPFNFCTVPLNDDCANAVTVPVNQDLLCSQTTNGTLAGATASPQANGCAGTANDDVWYTFTATADTHVISFGAVTPATGLNFGLYTGTDCGNLTQVSCTAGNSLIAGSLIPGQVYYVRVYSTVALAQTTTFFLCVGTVPCNQAPSFCSTQPVTYQNATNVPSLGQIGCLFTTPNPAFFFLQVNSAGPLNYLLTQSTTPNGAPNLDVDYVVWGPFADNAAACAAIPANPLPQGVCPALHACSYSAAPTETMCLPNAQLCQVYVVMITNFANQPGYVTFTQTNSTTPGGGQTECYPDTTFNYSQTSYCQNAPDPTPVLATGAIPGAVYTSTPGLVIDPATGTIDLSASTPGVYVVTSTYSISGEVTCTNFTNVVRTRTVIITAVPEATIAYSDTTICSSLPVQTVTATGTTGGTYSATPAGLFIDALSGSIVPNASTPGVYTITYTIPAAGGCDLYTTTTQVEILLAPNVFDPTDVTVCGEYTLPTLTTGEYYTQENGVGPITPQGTVVTQTTQFWIYASNAECFDQGDLLVTIENAPDLGQLDDQYGCSSFTLGTPAVGDYYSGPNGTGTIINGTTLTAPSTVVYVHAISGSCPADGQFTVFIGAIVTDTPADVTACDSYVLPALSANNHYWTGPNCTGTELAAGTVIEDTQIIYVCSSLGTCVGNVEQFEVTINDTPVLAPVNNLSDCSSVTLPTLTVGNYYTGPLGAGLITGADLTFSTPGTYTVYVYAETGTTPNCPSATNPSFTVTIYGQPDVDDVPSVTLCEGQTFTLPTLTQGAYYAETGGAGATFAAGYVVTQSMNFFVFQDNGGGCTDEVPFSVTINSNPQFTITGGCQGNAYVLTSEPVAGSFDPATAVYSWTSSNGTIVSGGDTAAATVSGAGTYTLTVSVSGCSGDEPFVATTTSCTIQKGISANGDGANDYF